MYSYITLNGVMKYVCFETKSRKKYSNVGYLSMTFVFNSLKTSGNYMYHLLYQSVTLHFVFMGFVWFSLQTAIISLNNVNQLIFVMVKCGVLFEVRTEFLNIMKMSVTH
jgi:D-alanyl-lipoteichoic acid acyltransferase DltB (MBOAT superfamily)